MAYKYKRRPHVEQYVVNGEVFNSLSEVRAKTGMSGWQFTKMIKDGVHEKVLTRGIYKGRKLEFRKISEKEYAKRHPLMYKMMKEKGKIWN